MKMGFRRQFLVLVGAGLLFVPALGRNGPCRFAGRNRDPGPRRRDRCLAGLDGGVSSSVVRRADRYRRPLGPRHRDAGGRGEDRFRIDLRRRLRGSRRRQFHGKIDQDRWRRGRFRRGQDGDRRRRLRRCRRAHHARRILRPREALHLDHGHLFGSPQDKARTRPHRVLFRDRDHRGRHHPDRLPEFRDQRSRKTERRRRSPPARSRCSRPRRMAWST